jgi:ribulose-phosphate 3-epimerase
MKKIEIIPAILPKDFAEVEEKTSLVKGSVKIVQIDVCDGQFVPNATWPYKREDDTFEKILHEEEGLPGWEKLDFEIDLMANNPEKLIEDWVIAGATRIVIHAESRGSVLDAVDSLTGRVDVGIALNIDTPADVLDPYKNKIQFVQCMGIEHVGFQGQEFDERVINKVKEVKEIYPHLLVSVDGGVSLETAPLLIEAGVDRLVVGSAIFGSDNFIEALQNFKKLGH